MAKGGKREGAGRPKGAVNKATADIYTMCKKKNGYGSEARARLVGNAMLRADKGQAAVLYTYQCPNCSRWHLTKRPNDQPAITKEKMIADARAIR